MSGASGGGGGWIDPIQDSCEKLSSETTLSSAVRSVIEQLKKGDLLDITVDSKAGARVVRAVYKGDVAGSITSTIIQKIVECIDKGHEYVAEVLSVQGGACRVLVRPK